MEYLLTGLQTARLDFRPIDTIRFSDWLPLFALPGPARMLGLELLPTPEAQCSTFLERAQQRIADGLGGLNALYSREDGSLVGACGLLVQEVEGIRELEVGYSLLPRHWGKGCATEAARAARDAAFDRGLAGSTLISIIHEENEPSKRVARNNGMQHTASTLFKGLFPAHVYRIARAQWQALPGRL